MFITCVRVESSIFTLTKKAGKEKGEEGRGMGAGGLNWKEQDGEIPPPPFPYLNWVLIIIYRGNAAPSLPLFPLLNFANTDNQTREIE
jgi:hypothetical protein